jgi:hypothetical protein
VADVEKPTVSQPVKELRAFMEFADTLPRSPASAEGCSSESAVKVTDQLSNYQLLEDSTELHIVME